MMFTLHSNMFLLIPTRTDIKIRYFLAFTFQYVSINTIVQQSESNETPLFTFQYVSINTQIRPPKVCANGFFFTFQYVSINTVS